MVSEMMDQLNSDEKRALRLLLPQAAHEIQDRPISVLSALAARGLVKRTPYIAHWRGKDWDCWETTLTEAGRQIARELPTPQRGGHRKAA